MALDDSRRQRRGQIYVALAAVAWSSAGVLRQRLSLDTVTQLAGRAAFAALALLLYVAIVERGRVVAAFRSVGLTGVGVALCLAVASGGFIAALNHTSVARVLFILAIAPVLAALLARSSWAKITAAPRSRWPWRSAGSRSCSARRATTSPATASR